MLKINKILSVALVVLMLLSTIAIGVYAVPAEGTDVGLVLVSDKTEAEIVPGAKVTVTFYFNLNDYSQKMSDFKVALLYDSNVYTPDTTSRVFLGDLAEYAKVSVTPKINANYGKAVMNGSSMSAADKKLYNNSVMFTVTADATNHNVTATDGYTVTEGENGLSIAEATMVFNVTGDEAALKAGNKNITICDTYNKNQQFIGYTNGERMGHFTKYDVSRANIMANMPSAPSYAVAKYKTQVKFTGDKTTAPDDLFQFRLTSVITAADFAAMNSNGNKIKSVGFIAANTGAADADAAKAAVEKGTALPSAWKAASTDYVSQADASSDAYFGAIVKNISHASQATDIDCIAYVCYNDGTADHYVWYSAAVTAKVASGYDAAVAAWKAQ
ncbi:MAG TPA: hypothetical protein DGG22_07765 [Ruminococcaceae bacterium]|nr:hypothetical protein [Oscillospiraceae bacterium]